jgi:hypothetical protein
LTIESKPSSRETNPAFKETAPKNEAARQDLPPLVLELHGLLKNNPGVKIINKPDHYTVLRQGKWVGGRINQLVFREAEVREYILAHPAAEIDGANLII